MADPNPEKIELEKIEPKKYPEELEKLAKEIEEGKRTDFSPEFKVEEKATPKIEKPRVPRILQKEEETPVAEIKEKTEPVPVVEKPKKAKKNAAVIIKGPIWAAKEEVKKETAPEGVAEEIKKPAEVQINQTTEQVLEMTQRRIDFLAEWLHAHPEKSERKNENLEDLKKLEIYANKLRKQQTKEQSKSEKSEKKAPESTPASAEASAGKPAIEKSSKGKKDEPKKELKDYEKVIPEWEREKLDPKEEKPAPEEPTRPESTERVEVEPLPEPEAGEPEDPKFNPEEALNDEGFLDFLTKYPDAEKVDPGIHKREIEKRFKMFGACKKLGETVGEFYNQEAGKELDLPIGEEMKRRMLEAVEREAITDPSALIKRTTEISEYGSLQKDINAFDKQLGELGGAKNKEEALRFIEESSKKLGKEKHQKKLSIGLLGFINPESNPVLGWWFRKIMTDEERGWREQIRQVPKEKRKEIFADIDKKIEAFAKAKTELEKVNESGMKQRFEDLRKEIFHNFEPAKMLFEDMQHRAAKTIGDMIKKAVHGVPGIQKIEAAKQYLEKLRISHKRVSFDVLDPKAFSMQIDQRLGEIVDSLVRENIKGFKITSKPMEKMFLEFSKLINKESAAQSKQEIVATIISAIDKTVDHLQESGRGKPVEEGRDLVAKKMLLQAVKARFLAELNK